MAGSVIVIEKVVTSKKVICNLSLWDGSQYVERTISDTEAWNIEIAAANAGYTGSVISNDIIGNSVHVKITWRE
jgi:hypothetical protein